MMAIALPDETEAALALPPLPSEGYYTLFTGRAVADPVRLFVADWRIRNRLWLRLAAISDGPFEAMWGRTPGISKGETRGSVLLRAPGTARRFGAVLEIHRGTPALYDVRFAEDGGVEASLYDASIRPERDMEAEKP
jgi:hypothetical protein